MSEDIDLLETNQLSNEELQRFYNEVEKSPTDRAPITGKACRFAFEFLEDTGLRITELLHVRKRDIDIKSRIVTVTHPKTEKKCKCSRWEYKNNINRAKKLVYADPNCKNCAGKGKWKKPQHTTFTPRIQYRLYEFLQDYQDDDLLWETTRKSFWDWGKKAGIRANIEIFQQKEERMIEGIFLHLFRALCSKRMKIDAAGHPYQQELISTKLRHSINSGIVTDRYTQIDINYLLGWEKRTYE